MSTENAEVAEAAIISVPPLSPPWLNPPARQARTFNPLCPMSSRGLNRRPAILRQATRNFHFSGTPLHPVAEIL